MTRCIIHIGMHKTGSTSIQNSLNGFDDTDFSYARLDSPNHSLAMYSLFADRPGQHHLHQAGKRNGAAMQAYNKAIRARLEQAIERSHGRTLIISGEDIGILSQDDLIKLRKYLEARVSELRIAGYVRPPAGFMASRFQQRVKGGNADKLDLELEYPHFRKYFGKFDHVFGRENVHLWKFDPKTFPSGCVVRDFCTRLGIALPDERIVRENESLNSLGVSLLYIYYKFHKKQGYGIIGAPERQAINGFLNSVSNVKFRFSPDIIGSVLQQNRADIEWMEARLGQSLQEELGEYQPGDVRDESDLLHLDPLIISKLIALLGDVAPEGIRGETPQEVALLVHAMRKMSARDNKEGIHMTGKANQTSGKPEDRLVTVVTLIEAIQQQNPELLEGIPRPKAAALLRNVFGQISDMLGQTQEGMIKVGGLGQFRVRQAEAVVEGSKATNARIVFRRAETGKAGKTEK